MPVEKKKAITLSIPVPIFKKLSRDSRRRGESKSSVVSYVLSKYYEDRRLRNV